ncbi:hypothetical protein BUALT_Bualt15G0127800 [Buddleja alternifolia]|uniref:Pseudouridine synthase RsuA/RluA-like domain-containing protein n=1 Tax=Buddleja alternifolia TaxID=168488 RepID=A0AAV6WG90_9LAMI|nr:hypothetical protein BUALT_Bualt15G0127800 [Buddleja alternifolia]
MRKKLLYPEVFSAVRQKPRSKIRPPSIASSKAIRVLNNIMYLGCPKEGPKPRQLLSLPPFPCHPLPGRKSTSAAHVTAISWLKYCFDDVAPPIIRIISIKASSVQMECLNSRGSSRCYKGQTMSMKKSEKLLHRLNMVTSWRWALKFMSQYVAESKISKRFDVIPSGTLYPNADEIDYLRRLVKYKDPAILVLNKPPKLPVKGNLSVHNSMDALAAAALSYDYDEGPKLVHRLDRETSGLLLMGRTKESVSYLHWLFSDGRKTKSLSKDWNDMLVRQFIRCIGRWSLVHPSRKKALSMPHLQRFQVLLNDGKTERVILAHNSGLEASQEAVTEYRVLGPMINGCSWIELRPHTRRKHQLRVHCAEALGTPIVGDYKNGWFVHNRWKQMPRVDFEPTTGEPYKLRRPDGLDVQKGSVLSKVPLLHLHCREMVLPNIAKFIELHKQNPGNYASFNREHDDVLRFVACMHSHMKISWNLMSSYLV